MAKYRKKPVVIEAVQCLDENRAEIEAMDGVDLYVGGPFATPELKDKVMFATIVTLEGNKTASVGDWIITGVANARYPCKPDIFEATYEPVEGGE